MKQSKKLLTCLMALVLALSMAVPVPQQAEAKKQTKASSKKTKKSKKKKVKVKTVATKKYVIQLKKSKTVKVKPGKNKVTWKVTKGKKVLKVKASGKYKQKAKFTAKKKGSAVVTATYGKKQVKYKVTVKKKLTAADKNTNKQSDGTLKVDVKVSYVLAVGKSRIITVDTKDSVSWSVTQGTDIVSVTASGNYNEKGKIKAEKTGSAVVIAVYGDITAEYDITVKDKLTPAEINAINAENGTEVDPSLTVVVDEDNPTNSIITVKNLSGTRLELKDNIIKNAWKDAVLTAEGSVVYGDEDSGYIYTKDAENYFQTEAQKLFQNSVVFGIYPGAGYFKCACGVKFNNIAGTSVSEEGSVRCFFSTGDIKDNAYDWKSVAENDVEMMYKGEKLSHVGSKWKFKVNDKGYIKSNSFFGYYGTVYYGDNFVLEHYKFSTSNTTSVYNTFECIELLSEQGCMYSNIDDQVSKEICDALGITDFLKAQNDAI